MTNFDRTLHKNIDFVDATFWEKYFSYTKNRKKYLNNWITKSKVNLNNFFVMPNIPTMCYIQFQKPSLDKSVLKIFTFFTGPPWSNQSCILTIWLLIIFIFRFNFQRCIYFNNIIKIGSYHQFVTLHPIIQQSINQMQA